MQYQLCTVVSIQYCQWDWTFWYINCRSVF